MQAACRTVMLRIDCLTVRSHLQPRAHTQMHLRVQYCLPASLESGTFSQIHASKLLQNATSCDSMKCAPAVHADRKGINV